MAQSLGFPSIVAKITIQLGPNYERYYELKRLHKFP